MFKNLGFVSDLAKVAVRLLKFYGKILFEAFILTSIRITYSSVACILVYFYFVLFFLGNVIFKEFCPF